MIHVNQLNFTYPKSGKHAVKDVSFHINKGEIFGFLGPSGAGKTTTQRIIIGLLRNYGGSVKVFNSERSTMGKDFFEKIGIAFDFPNLYEKLTAWENLKLISSYYQKQPENLLDLFERVDLTASKDQKVESYSKGMKMRLNFIRAIMHDPDILFFDEPTSGLDPMNAKIIKDTIVEMKEKGKTIFLTTHNMTVADQLCDRVAFIVDGKIPVIDSPKDLKIKYGSSTVQLEYFDGSHVQSLNFPLEQIGTHADFHQKIKKYSVRTIHSQEATLEDIFIQVTGKELV
ncbi:ABC transporter ATP-binding protein [Vallitalea okinawensis]|uniref:ABC transporter ATP-binding protein n=1 Tax=Vallitalea okinawensis TaxID=2078660 RepID=UPI000CFAF338|nr:ABC transporter ATP-binding protein [Vallitalea okinawensis]